MGPCRPFWLVHIGSAGSYWWMPRLQDTETRTRTHTYIERDARNAMIALMEFVTGECGENEMRMEMRIKFMYQ